MGRGRRVRRETKRMYWREEASTTLVVEYWGEGGGGRE